MGQSHPQALGDLGVDFIPHCYTDNLESGCSSYRPLDAYESSYGATDLEKKEKEKEGKRREEEEEPQRACYFEKGGCWGLTF